MTAATISIRSTLEELGISSKPEALLVRDDAFFALVDDLLIYRDAGTRCRIHLRDLTRIHSDDTGLLRIETPAGTALTASLLGFEPDEVQPFFLRVRDATAYAKAQARRAQERQRGEAPPSPFARVPRAEADSAAPAHAESSAPAGDPRGAESQAAPPQAAEGEPQVSAAVRAVRRRPAPPPEKGHAEEAPISPEPAPQAAHLPPSAPPAPEPAEPAVLQTVTLPPAPPTVVTETVRDEAPQEEGAAQPSAVGPAGASPAFAWRLGGLLRGANAPDIAVWPPRLRAVAWALLLTALGLTLYYLLAGALASALWLLVVGAASAVFLLAAADALQVLAHSLPEGSE